MTEQYIGSVFIVAAPSGGGKTSLVKKLVNEMNSMEISISHTTRDKRAGEVDGIDYFFVSKDIFSQMIEKEQFIEHAHVFGCHYGTSFEQIHKRLQRGIDVILDIDWQGAAQIRQQFPNTVSVFILPPSLTELKQRLMSRKRDNLDIIEDRMQRAQDEMRHYEEFDYLIINDDFEKAALELQFIVQAHRLRLASQQIVHRKLLSLLLMKG